MLNHKLINTSVGKIHLVSDGTNLLGLCFSETWEKEKLQFGKLNTEDCPVFHETERQLLEYFSGNRKSFKLPILTVGTPFQELAWGELKKIPYGQTLSYSEQAKKIGKSLAVRAVGSANKKNPIAIVIPCHRVISKSGRLSGFNAGVDLKQKLLELEKRNSSS